MYEDNSGTSIHEGERKLPPDSQPYGRLSTWVLYTSKGAGEVIIDVTDYHPGALHLRRADLEAILAKLTSEQ